MRHTSQVQKSIAETQVTPVRKVEITKEEKAAQKKAKVARQKQKDKLERRDQRKTEKREPGSGPEMGVNEMLVAFDDEPSGLASEEKA